jgi:hypothetical protein
MEAKTTRVDSRIMVTKSSSRHLSGMFHAHWTLCQQALSAPPAWLHWPLSLAMGKMEDRNQLKPPRSGLQKRLQQEAVTQDQLPRRATLFTERDLPKQIINSLHDEKGQHFAVNPRACLHECMAVLQVCFHSTQQNLGWRRRGLATYT